MEVLGTLVRWLSWSWEDLRATLPLDFPGEILAALEDPSSDTSSLHEPLGDYLGAQPDFQTLTALACWWRLLVWRRAGSPYSITLVQPVVHHLAVHPELYCFAASEVGLGVTSAPLHHFFWDALDNSRVLELLDALTRGAHLLLTREQVEKALWSFWVFPMTEDHYVTMEEVSLARDLKLLVWDDPAAVVDMASRSGRLLQSFIENYPAALTAHVPMPQAVDLL